jgi:photosystem II stability/assembly factor-like uncharacterized protein
MKVILLSLILVSANLYHVNAQKSNAPIPDSVLRSFEWRNIGPFRAGRSLAVAGSIKNPLLYYFGATGGGVWKSIDGGMNWLSISDSTFHSSSVGAIAIAPSDENVVYVGMGEADMRSNISFGDGMYKSTNAGKTWKRLGPNLADAIANIEVHPQNSDIVYFSAMGNPFQANKERGIYRSMDGGKNWQLILSKNDSTGGASVRIDPNNPRVIYATLWQAYRNGFSMSSGGTGSGLYKSVDGGDTWVCLNTNPGMPIGILGKIGITVSKKNSNRLYALIESKKGGLFTSDDAGESWTLINEDKNLWQRPWYYMNLAADPLNENELIVLNVNAMKSYDGGKTFKYIPVQHGDTHDIWINPNNGSNYIIGNDGGAEVTFNDGQVFTNGDVPTAQFYHVSLDNDFPYHVYGAQQDNSSIRIASRTDGYSIGSDSWYPVAGGEAGYIQADPTNSSITYGGEYDGYLSKYSKSNEQYQDISVYPETNIGASSAAKKFRFQWTYPIVFSPHNPKKIYVTSQFVHVSEDAGYSWSTISPDLSRNDPKTTGETGGPITKDMTGAEVYATIFTFDESPIEKGVLWAGSDDGYIHLSRDNGGNWQKVNIPSKLLPEFALISIIHASEFTKGKAYVAANKYMFGDKKPYLFKTEDYGKTWQLITKGIPSGDYCRVIREDPNMQGLLYAGTERGIYVSFDDGGNWQCMNSNLPLTPIRDLRIQKREKDLVVATHGRSFWILDDLSPLYELKKGMPQNDLYVFKPRASYRMGGGQAKGLIDEGTNAVNGVLVHYYLKNKPSKEIEMQFLTEKNDTIITYSSIKDKKGKPFESSKDFYELKDQPRNGKLDTKTGMLNTFVWNMRYPDAEEVNGKNIMWAGNGRGAKVVPGIYKVRLIENKILKSEQTFEILADPRVQVSAEDLKAQFELLQKINSKISDAHKAINKLLQVRLQLNAYISSIKDTALASEFRKQTKPMFDKMDQVESNLMQPKAKAPQDVLAFPVMLNDKMAGLGSNVSSADSKPNKNAYEVFDDLSKKIDAQILILNNVVNIDVPAFNELVKKKGIAAVRID